MPKRVMDCWIGDEEDGTRRSSETMRRAPKGHFVVYVGVLERKRFVVPTWLLKNPMFQKLLDESEAEFGFGDAQNRIVLPCDVAAFRDFLITSLAETQVTQH